MASVENDKESVKNDTEDKMEVDTEQLESAADLNKSEENVDSCNKEIKDSVKEKVAESTETVAGDSENSSSVPTATKTPGRRGRPGRKRGKIYNEPILVSMNNSKFTMNTEDKMEVDTEQLESVADLNKSEENVDSCNNKEIKDSVKEKVAESTETVAGDSENSSSVPTETKTPGRRGRPGRKRGKIYSEDDDPDTIREKKKKRAVELKLKNLKCTFNETATVSGKRQKKAPQRFELQPVEKRKSSVDDGKGRGEFLGNISWVNHQLRSASLYTLRLLHRLIYRKQGMFAEKHIIKSVMKFNGFPFDASHPELIRRQDQLVKLPTVNLQQLSHLLGLRPGSNEEMIERIIKFLLCPSQKDTEYYVTDVMENKLQQSKLMAHKKSESPYQKSESPHFMNAKNIQEDGDHSAFSDFLLPICKLDLDSPWKKPDFFVEGNGVKLKYIRAVIGNIEAASDAFIELMHRLLFLNVDEKVYMRRNILEFSGLKCDIGTPNYVYRVRILSVLPMEQLKLICRVLCLPTWHRSRQFLTDGIMDFLSVPRISAMKKRVPPVFSEEISFSFDSAKVNQVRLPELKSAESEEIEIVPDIHIPDETSSHLEGDFHMESEYIGVKLRNFSNIHYQVISTPAVKLVDVHMILYLTTSAQNNIRKSILEFSGFPFEESSAEYQCRRTLMEQMSVEDLKTVATVLCVYQYICDQSKKSLIDAILKFLVNPAALLSSSTIMPTITQAPIARANPPVVKKKATSTSFCSPPKRPIVIKPEIVISSVGSSGDSKNSSMKAILDALSSSGKKESKTEIEKVKACLSRSAIEITPVPEPKTSAKTHPSLVIESPNTVEPSKVLEPAKVVHKKSPKVKEPAKISDQSSKVVESVHVTHNQAIIKTEPKDVNGSEADEPLSVVKEDTVVAPKIQYFDSDDDDDQPLSKMIGHPNDDQLKALVSKIIKESKLEDITMKHVIRKVFEAYPNYDLNYRREFIKSNVRLILSQMDDQSCSVSTTVISI